MWLGVGAGGRSSSTSRSRSRIPAGRSSRGSGLSMVDCGQRPLPAALPRCRLAGLDARESPEQLPQVAGSRHRQTPLLRHRRESAVDPSQAALARSRPARVELDAPGARFAYGHPGPRWRSALPLPAARRGGGSIGGRGGPRICQGIGRTGRGGGHRGGGARSAANCGIPVGAGAAVAIVAPPAQVRPFRPPCRRAGCWARLGCEGGSKDSLRPGGAVWAVAR